MRAIREQYPPEQIIAMLQETYNVAKARGSGKVMLAVTETVMGYTLGKPKQSLEVGTADSSQLLAALLSDRRPLLPPREGIIEPPLLLEGDADGDIDTDN